LLGCILIDELLGAPLIVDVIESKTLPHAEMRVDIHILLPLLLGHFSSKVFHYCTLLVVLPNLYNGSKLTPLYPLPRQWRPDSNNDPEVLVARGVLDHPLSNVSLEPTVVECC